MCVCARVRGFVCVCAGRCQGQLEREFYQFNLKVRESASVRARGCVHAGVCMQVCACVCVCVCEGGPREMKEETFFFSFYED